MPLMRRRSYLPSRDDPFRSMRPMAHIGTALEMAQGAVESLVAKPSVGIRTQTCANGEGLLAALAEHK